MSVKCTNESEDPSYISNGYEGLLYAAKAGFFSQANVNVIGRETEPQLPRNSYVVKLFLGS